MTAGPASQGLLFQQPLIISDRPITADNLSATLFIALKKLSETI